MEFLSIGWQRVRRVATPILLMIAAIVAVVVVWGATASLATLVVRALTMGLVAYILFTLVARFSHAPSAFDGAGEEYQGPGWIGPIVVVVAVIGAIVVNWLANGWLFDMLMGLQ